MAAHCPRATSRHRHAPHTGTHERWAYCGPAALTRRARPPRGRTRGTVCRMGEMSVYRYSSLRMVGIRSVRSAAAHSARTGASLPASLRSVAECGVRRGRRTGALRRCGQSAAGVSRCSAPQHTGAQSLAGSPHRPKGVGTGLRLAHSGCGSAPSASAYAASVCATHVSSAAAEAATAPRAAAGSTCVASSRAQGWCLYERAHAAAMGACLPPAMRHAPISPLELHMLTGAANGRVVLHSSGCWERTAAGRRASGRTCGGPARQVRLHAKARTRPVCQQRIAGTAQKGG